MQRVMYQAQYLTDLGHKVWVATESEDKVWVSDATLSPTSIPVDHIVRSKQYPLPLTRILDRLTRRLFGTSILYPDDFALWTISTYRKATALIRKHNLETLLVSLGHPSALLVAFFLKKRFPELNLVIDVRDLWAGSPVGFMGRNRHGVRQKLNQYFERIVFNHADCIITVSEGLKSDIEKRYPGIRSDTHVVHNGYDEAAFSQVENLSPALKKHECIRIVYTGFVIPEQKPEAFFAALSEFVHSMPDIHSKLRVEFYGGSQAYVDRLANEFNVTAYVQSHAYVRHCEAIKHMSDADLLLLFRVPHSGVLSGKLFEYMRSGTPILAFDQGNYETRHILEETGSGEWVSVNDTAGQFEALSRLTSARTSSVNRSTSQNQALKHYSRYEQTRRLSNIIDNIIDIQPSIDSTLLRKEAA